MNGEATVLPEGVRTLLDVVRWRAEERPSETAYVWLEDGSVEGARLDFAALDRRCRALAVRLRELGLRPGARAILAPPPGLDFVVGFLGAIYAGAAPVPLYPPDPARLDRSLPRFLSALRDARPSVLLTSKELVAAAAALPGGLALPALALDEVAEQGADDWSRPEVDESSVAFLQYTSGSTGDPKGIVVRHRQILGHLSKIETDIGPDRFVRSVSWMPMYHDMGLVAHTLLPVFCGVTSVLMPPLAFLQQPLRWLRSIARYRATWSGSPNFGFELCVRRARDADLEGLDLSSWLLAYSGAEPVRPDTFARFADRFAPCGFRREALCGAYGLAESTLMVSMETSRRPPRTIELEPKALEANRVVPLAPGSGGRVLVACGRAGFGSRVAIVRPDGTPADPGEVGEIWVRCWTNADGYWNRPDETASTFAARLADGDGPFLRTGDLGFLDADGEVYVTGRIKDLVILAGQNHYPSDLERTVESAHPSVRPGCVAAFAVERPTGEELVVVAEVADGSTDPSGVAAAVRQAIWDGHAAALAELVLIRSGSIPKTSSGKIQRRACREAYLAGRLARLDPA